MRSRSGIRCLKRPPQRADARRMDRRGLITGVLVSLPFTLSVALLCTTTGADAFYSPLSVATMLAVFLVPMGLQIACGVRAFLRGEPLLRPLASVTASYLTGAFAIMLAADAIVRLSGVKGAALPAGLGGAFAEWVSIMLSLASVPALSGLVVVVGVAAARSRA
jgi:hypothetical protein